MIDCYTYIMCRYLVCSHGWRLAEGQDIYPEKNTSWPQRLSWLHSSGEFPWRILMLCLLVYHQMSKCLVLCVWSQHYASRSGHVAVCDFLLENGALASPQTPGGATPLHRSAYCGHLGVVRTLLHHRADPLLSDDDGATPLHKVPRFSYHSLSCNQTKPADWLMFLNAWPGSRTRSRRGVSATSRAQSSALQPGEQKAPTPPSAGTSRTLAAAPETSSGTTADGDQTHDRTLSRQRSAQLRTAAWTSIRASTEWTSHRCSYSLSFSWETLPNIWFSRSLFRHSWK